jgi:hypothetical protein
MVHWRPLGSGAMVDAYTDGRIARKLVKRQGALIPGMGNPIIRGLYTGATVMKAQILKNHPFFPARYQRAVCETVLSGDGQIDQTLMRGVRLAELHPRLRGAARADRAACLAAAALCLPGTIVDIWREDNFRYDPKTGLVSGWCDI